MKRLEEKIALLLAQCERQLESLERHAEAVEEVMQSGKLTKESVAYHPEISDTVKLFIADFGKLQDLLGKAILNTMQYVQKETMPFLDALGYAQKFGVLEIKDEEWEEMRIIRNAFSHDYPMDEAEIYQAVLAALKWHPFLKKAYLSLKDFIYARKPGICRLADELVQEYLRRRRSYLEESGF